MPFWQALIVGFVLFNLLGGLAIAGWAFVSLDWVVGLFWFLAKTYAFVFTFVWMRGTLPRVRIDQLMGFAWKVLIPLGLFNVVATAAVVLWAPHWKLAMAIYSWLGLIAFVGLFDALVRWRLKRQRRRVAVLT